MCVSAASFDHVGSLYQPIKDHNNLIDKNMKMQIQPIIFDFTPDSHVRVITVITVITKA